jgi:hypothetical protein
MKLIACKRYPKKDASAALEALVTVICNSGGMPKLAEGTTKPVNDAVTARMTDTSQYTGAHKERFDQVYLNDRI